MSKELLVCSKCGESKDLSRYSRNGRGFRRDCKDCRRAYTKRWTGNNKERVRQVRHKWFEKNKEKYEQYILEYRERMRPITKAKRRARTLLRFNLTPEEYEAKLSTQNGGCAICGVKPSEKKALAVDHCHEKGGVRGILCGNCNNGLGRFKDSTELLEKAITYLSSY